MHYEQAVPRGDLSAPALRARFVEQARAAACSIYPVDSPAAATQTILSLIGDDKLIVSWDLAQVAIPGLAESLSSTGIQCAEQNSSARIGLTGADAGLAATGSLVLQSGPGRPRSASLLPPVHIAVLAASQIRPDLESWLSEQSRAGLGNSRHHSNIVFITGPSRTADIAMELVMGMHGPRELHVILRTDS